jgi:hypothetical protein
MENTGKCKICNSRVELTTENKIEGTDFVTYGYVCSKCRHAHGKERIAELLNLPGVVKIR